MCHKVVTITELWTTTNTMSHHKKLRTNAEIMNNFKSYEQLQNLWTTSKIWTITKMMTDHKNCEPQQELWAIKKPWTTAETWANTKIVNTTKIINHHKNSEQSHNLCTTTKLGTSKNYEPSDLWTIKIVRYHKNGFCIGSQFCDGS